MKVNELLKTKKSKKLPVFSSSNPGTKDDKLYGYGVPLRVVDWSQLPGRDEAGTMVEGSVLQEKRPAGSPKWHDSDAPDANGKFKELGINDLADWLIKTRGGNLQKISGSLNQQIVFNRKKNPSYADKMESVRTAVKRKLAKKNESLEIVDDLLTESGVDTALKNKSEKSGVGMRTLRAIYNRGLAAWRKSHRPGTNAPQWAMARVNSVLSGGPARKSDKDLWAAR
jgi:hypothetical protein